MRFGIVEGEPGVFPDPIARLVGLITRPFRRSPHPGGHSEPTPPQGPTGGPGPPPSTDRDQVLVALDAEGAQLGEVVFGLAEDDFDRPTRCPPWSVRDLLAHVLVASNRLPAMLDAPEPAEAQVAAAEYYRPDERFGPDATRARVAAATTDAAAFPDGRALAKAFDAAWREMAARARAEPPTRRVRTRWGDAMTLTDFLATRVVELGVHGLDLARALERPPWLTPEAAAVIVAILAPGPAVAELGWDAVTAIEAVTGRRPLAEAEAQAVAADRAHRPTFG